jgi:hypothetical protein
MLLFVGSNSKTPFRSGSLRLHSITSSIDPTAIPIMPAFPAIAEVHIPSEVEKAAASALVSFVRNTAKLSPSLGFVL